jgi:hypothetical protein
MVILVNEVVVFGEDYSGMYIESFEKDNGKNRFRFCTSYWGGYSEDWNPATQQ